MSESPQPASKSAPESAPRPALVEAEEWDVLYAEQGQRWSGNVNGVLAVEADELEPGRALDIGCGEGADAIWLSKRGWKVTAVDISEVAIGRATDAGAEADVDIEWLAADVLDPSIGIGDGGYELVSLQYPAFAIDRLDDVMSLFSATVAPGGLLLVAGHCTDGIESPWDPADYVQPGDVASALGDGWLIEVQQTRPRVGGGHRHDHHGHDEPSGEPSHRHVSPHTHDVVLRARRS